MTSPKPFGLIGVGMSLESMRRGFIGGSALSLFIIKEFGLERGAKPTLDFMKGYLAVEEQLIQDIPLIMNWYVRPVTDYHDANVIYTQILEILAEAQRPSACQFYWDKESQ